MKITVIVHTLLFYILLASLCLFLMIPFCLFFLFPEEWRYKSRIFAYFLRCAYWLLLKCTLVPITYKGATRLPGYPVIVAANHQSTLDIPLVGLLCGTMPHIWLAWSELFKRPFHNPVLSRVALPIDVDSPLKAMRSLMRALKMLADYKMHAIIFPEGARFTDGQIHDFFAGFVMLAKKTGCPVVPVRIFNAHTVYPPHSLWVYWHRITVVVGQPMAMLENESDEDFKERVRQWFLETNEG